MKKVISFCAILFLTSSFCAYATTETTKQPAKKQTTATVIKKKVAATTKKEPPKARLYFAAALFNGRETRFNLDITEQLEKLNYQVILPQRDGFEYVAMRKAMKRYLPNNDDVVKTTRDLIYLLDMGVFIPQSDIIIANLDEPLDEGVIVEVTYAHMIGKPVIGFRTDSRSPFGHPELLGGMHAFVAFQTDHLIRSAIPAQSLAYSSAAITKLAAKIDNTIEKMAITKDRQLPEYALSNPVVINMVKAAKMIFKDIRGLHSKVGLEKTVRRMAVYRQKVNELAMPLKVTQPT